MAMRPVFFFFISVIFTVSAQAEARKWMSKDGTKFIIADYVSHNQFTVTVKRVDGKVVTLDRGDLHRDDVNFLAKLPGSTPPASKKTEEPPASAPV